MKSEAKKKIFDLEAGGGTNINAALLNATNLAKSISRNASFEAVKQTMIIFLSDGDANVGITNNQRIKDNIRISNEGQVPIYGLAFGNGADFDLLKDISNESGAFTKRIYESGNSFEQLENFYKEISDPKLRNVTFEYIANGKLIPTKLLIGTRIQNAYGKNEYIITGEFEDPEIELEEFEIVTTGKDANGFYTRRSLIDPCSSWRGWCCNCHPLVPEIPNPSEIKPVTTRLTPAKWEQSPAESFMERLWAFKRIKFLLHDDVDCEKGIHENKECFTWNDKFWEGIEPKNPVETECGLESCIDCGEKQCSEEAVDLAKKYNFVTKATSLVVESDDDYIKNGSIEIDATVFKPTYENSFNSYYSGHSGTQVNTAQFNNWGSQIGTQVYKGVSSNFGPLCGSFGCLPKFSSGGGGGFNNLGSQIGTQIDQGTRFNFPGMSQIGQQFGHAPMPITPNPTLPYSQSSQCKLTFYSLTHFRGESVEITRNVNSLKSLNFDDKVASVNVEGNCCWKIFVNDNFIGDSMQLRHQEYRSAVDIQKIYQKASSVQILNQC